MPTDKKITIKFEAQGDKKLINAINALDKAQRKLEAGFKGTGKALDKNRKRIGKNTDKLKKHGGVINKLKSLTAQYRNTLLLFSFAMSLGVRQLSRFAKQAAKLESMTRAFNSLQGSAGNATVAINKLRAATNNTISDFDLFQQANNAMILGITKNSDVMSEMFDVAQRLGRALGKDTKFSVESLITGIGRQSRLMLDNIGIIVKVEQANKKMAVSLGVSVDKLTESQKKQAFLNATMEAAREKVSRLGKEIQTSQDAFDRLSAASSNAADAIGEALMPAIEPLVDMMAALMRALTVDRIRNFGIAIGVTAIAVGGLALATFGLELSIIAAGIAFLNLQAIMMANPFIALASVIAIATFALLEMFDAFKSKDVIIENNKAMEEMADNTDEAAKALERYKSIIQGISDINILEGWLEPLESSIGTLQAELKIISDTASMNVLGLKPVAEVLKQGSDEAGVFSNLFKGIEASAGQIIPSLREAKDVTSEIADLEIRRLLIVEAIAKAQIQNEIFQSSIIPNLEHELALMKNKEQFSGAELEFRNFILDLEKRGIDLTDIGIEQLLKIQGLMEEMAERDETTQRIENIGKITQAYDATISSIEAVNAAVDAKANKEIEAARKEELAGVKNIRSKKARARAEKAINDKFDKQQAEREKKAEDRAKKLLLWKKASAITNTLLAITQVLRDDTLPWWGKIPMSILIGAQGYSQVRAMEGKEFAQGGMVGGNLHSQGGTPIIAERGEFVMSRRAVDAVGEETMNRINEGQSSGGVNVTFTGNVNSQDFIEEEAIPAIREAIRRGADIGVG